VILLIPPAVLWSNYIICHKNGHDADVPQAYRMKMLGKFNMKIDGLSGSPLEILDQEKSPGE